MDPLRPQGERLTSFRFTPVAARRLLTIRAEVRDGDADPTGTVLSEIGRHDLAGAIVRLRVSIGSEEEPLLEDARLRAALGGAHYLVSISREIRHGASRTRLGEEYNASVDPQRVLELYLRASGVPDDRASVLREYAASLIAEDEPV